MTSKRRENINLVSFICLSFLFVVLARNCLASTLDYIVMQMRKINCGKGYWLRDDYRPARRDI